MSIILNDRDKALQAAAFRTMSTVVDITSSNGSAFRTLKNGGVTTPDNTTLTATVSSIFTAAAIYTWQYSLSTSATTWVDISSGTTNTLLISSTSILANIGSALSINYKCVVTEPGLITATGIYNLTYNKELSESIVIDMTRTNAVVPCNSSGVPTSFTNTGTTISVSRGTTALLYSATGGANTFKVDIQADDVARTVGTISTTTNTYSISGITALTVDLATIVFAITVYDAAGVAVSPLFGKQITYTKVTNGVVGADVTSYYIDSSSPVISKTTAGALLPGTHSQITVTGKKAIGSTLPSTYGFLTLTPNGVTEATVATADSITTSIGNSDGKTIYTINMYNQPNRSGATLLDTMTVPVIFTGANAITAILTNESSSIPTNFSGTVGVYTGSGTDVHVYEGSTELTYDGIGASTGTWTISTFASNITIGAITAAGLYAKVANASNLLSSTASIVYTITGISGGGVPFTITKTQSFGRTTDGKDGASFAISNSMSVFNKDGAGNKTPASLTISTAYQNITGTITYQWQKNGTDISGANASTYNVLIADYASVTTNTYKCTVTGTINAVVGSSLSDQITIPLLADGPGAINVTNSNENITFTAPNTGYTGILFGSSAVTIRAFIGTIALTYDASATPANNTFKVSQAVSGFSVAAGTGTGTTYTVAAPTAASADSGFIIFTVTIKDSSGVSTTTTTTTTYSLSRLGSTASTFSITNSAPTFVKNEAGVISPSSLTLNTTYVNITSPTYQWYKGTTLIVGATGASYSITGTTNYPAGTENNQFSCVITGTINGVASSTLTDYVSVPLLVAGSSAITVNNSNENIVFSAPNTGYTGITFTNSSFVVRAYIGTTALAYDATGVSNNTFKVAVVTTGATVAAGSSTSGTTYTVPAPTAMSSDAAATVVTVTVKNATGQLTDIVTTTTYGLSRVGATAGMFNIANSAVIFTKNAAGSVLPISSILTTTSQNITSPTYQWQKNGADISGATTSTYTVLIADYASVTTNTYKCTVTGTIAGVSSSTLSDQITIPLLSDGSSTITVNNSNENISFPSSTSGYSGINFTNGSFVVRAYLGTTALAYDAAATPANNTFKVSVVTTGATVAAGSGTGTTYTVPAPTAMSVDAASTVVTITVKNAAGVSTDIVTTTTYSLSRAGPLGSTFNIANSIVVFSKNNAGSITPATATLSTEYVNIITPTYQWYKNGAVISGATLSTYDVLNSEYSSAATNTYKCIVSGTINGTASTLSDQITVPLLTDGATTPSIVNSNENITFIAENSGYSNISFTKGSFTITAYLGTTALTYDATATPANSTFKVTFAATGATVAAGSGSGSTYTVPAPTAMSVDSASNLLTITIKDAGGVSTVFTKTTYYNLSRMGNPGASFVINNSFAAFNKDAAGNKTPSTLSLTTAYQNITGTITYQWQKNATNISGATTSVYIVPIADYATVSTNTYKCTISGIINGSASTISDQITIPLLADGLGAISVLNSNENITFTAPATGYTGITFGTSTIVIRAFIGTTDLTYDAAAIPANDTFKVTQSVSGFSVATGTGTGSTYTVAAPTAATADSGFITFTITIKDSFGVSTTSTSTTTFSLSRTGITPAIFNISNSAAILTKNEAGTLAPATLVLSTAYQSITTPTYQWQKNGANISGATAATYTITAATDYTSGIESNTYKCTVTGTMGGVAAQTLSDQITVPLLVAGSSAVTVNNSNENIVFSAPNTGYTGITFTSGGFVVRAYIGTLGLTYDAAATPANSTFKVTVVTTGATVAAGTGSGTTYTIPAPTAMSTDSASTVVTVTVKNAAGVLSTISTTTTYGLSRVGPTGVGNKSVTISAYAWGLTMPTIPTTSYTYTWSTGAITYPTGWVKQPTIGTTGQTLYQINLIITGTTSDVTTAGIDWAAATSNTVGYRLDGSIGPQGTSARVAYVVTTRITPPPSPTAGTGDVIPSSKVTNTDGTEVPWKFEATATLLDNQYMYTVDGIWTATATTINGVSIAANNIAWGVPYLSNLKVGSLSALSANLGVINAGSLNINNKFMVDSTGATTIQSGTTGARMLTTENFIKIFDANGVLRVQLGNLSL